jgi:Fe2+ or Zn2+ uptake regulation protein
MSERGSRQREVVLETVRSTLEHPTAEWVFAQARRRLPRLGLGTVYRNLKRLAAEGHIREIHRDGTAARYDGNTGRHYHLRCVRCGRLTDLPVSVDCSIEEKAARATRYRILGHELDVEGVCPACHSENDYQIPVASVARPAVKEKTCRSSRTRRPTTT